MIGQDKLAEERKRRAMNGEVIFRVNGGYELRQLLMSYVCKAKVVTDRNGRFQGVKMTMKMESLELASDDLNTALRPEFSEIDKMNAAKQQDAAARMKTRIDSNLEDAGFEGMRVQIDLQPARARLVKVEM
jgi:ABC-type phosphate transport system auxiliary subunit